LRTPLLGSWWHGLARALIEVGGCSAKISGMLCDRLKIDRQAMDDWRDAPA